VDGRTGELQQLAELSRPHGRQGLVTSEPGDRWSLSPDGREDAGHRHVEERVEDRVDLLHRRLVGHDHVQVAAHAVPARLDLDQPHLQGPLVSVEQRHQVVRQDVAPVPVDEGVDALVGAARDALGGDPHQAARRGASEPPIRTAVSRTGSSGTVRIAV
jgi:hypothetical protein